MLVDKRNASRITSSRSLKSATFLSTGWRLSHQTELPGYLPVPLECHTLTLNTIELQLSSAVADTSMLQFLAQFRIQFIDAHIVAENASHALASFHSKTPFQRRRGCRCHPQWMDSKEEEDNICYSFTYDFTSHIGSGSLNCDDYPTQATFNC